MASLEENLYLMCLILIMCLIWLRVIKCELFWTLTCLIFIGIIGPYYLQSSHVICKYRIAM